MRPAVVIDYIHHLASYILIKALLTKTAFTAGSKPIFIAEFYLNRQWVISSSSSWHFTTGCSLNCEMPISPNKKQIKKKTLVMSSVRTHACWTAGWGSSTTHPMAPAWGWGALPCRPHLLHRAPRSPGWGIRRRRPARAGAHQHQGKELCP